MKNNTTFWHRIEQIGLNKMRKLSRAHRFGSFESIN